MAKPKRKLKAIPEFRTESEKRQFWETHDSADYVDWSAAAVVKFSRRRPPPVSTKTMNSHQT
jgi:hypothetical protein